MRKLIALALLAVLSTPLMAAECATTIEGSDAMQFNQKTITVPKTCKSFAVTLYDPGGKASEYPPESHVWTRKTPCPPSPVAVTTTEPSPSPGV